MKQLKYQSKNMVYFSKTLIFAHELITICNNIGIRPVVYGSLAYAFYTNDQTININDIDILVPKLDLSKVASIEVDNNVRVEETSYPTVKFYKSEAKVSFHPIEKDDLIDQYDLVEGKINGYQFTFISLESLLAIYKKGTIGELPKKEEYIKKIKVLQNYC